MKLTAIAVMGLVLVPFAARAAGGHDAVGCAGCHPRKAGPGGYALERNTKYLDPRTNEPYPGTTGVCLACHQQSERGGRGHLPISRHISHPFGLATVNPKVATVPPDLLRDGRLECMSCHEPHPSNANYKYLRIDIGTKGERMDSFCAVCHPSKASAGT